MNKGNRPGRRRIVVDLPMDLYKKVAKLKTDYNCTLAEWTIKVFAKEVQKELSYRDQSELD